MAPFPIVEIFGKWGAYAIYLLIGIGFGAVLEMAGFGNSMKLAGQFYFKEQTVLKVMFTAIVVAMVMVFAASGLGLLDYNLVWVNPTYLWPGIVGGLVMGAGFIIGGFCPGTSLVSAATLKIDGIFFALGTFFGIFLFGETVGFYEDFWYSSYMGRFTLPDLFGVPTGVVVVGIILMALGMFWGAEHLERIFGKVDLSQAPKWRYAAAGGLIMASLAVLVIGQPTTADKWARVEAEKEALLSDRAAQIHPGELLSLMQDRRLNLIMLDVRSEADYNIFHIRDARHVAIDELMQEVGEMYYTPENTVFVLMSNDESDATEAWRLLTAESVPNVYLLEGGLNNWIATFAEPTFLAEHPPVRRSGESLAYAFPAALGDRYSVSSPNPDLLAGLEYVPKVVLKSKRGATGGGCG